MIRTITGFIEIIILLYVMAIYISITASSRSRCASMTCAGILLCGGMGAFAIANALPEFSDQLILTALGEKGESSLGYEIVLDRYIVDDRVYYPTEAINGKWFWRGSQYMWRSEGDPRQPEGVTRSIKLNIPVGFDRRIEFDSNSYRGMVEVLLGDMQVTVDTAVQSELAVSCSTLKMIIINIAARLGCFLCIFVLSFGIVLRLTDKLDSFPERLLIFWQKNWSIPVVILVILGCLFYMQYYSRIQGLWLDELCQIGFGLNKSLSQALEPNLNLTDGSAPIFAVLAYFWYRIAPYGEQWLLLLPEMAVCMGIVFLSDIMRRLKGNCTSVLMAVVACSSAVVVLQCGIEFRPYGITFLFSSFVIWTFFRRKNGIKYRIMYSLAMAGLVYSHYIAVLICLALFIVDVICFFRKNGLKQWFWQYLVAAILFIPWCLAVILHLKGTVVSSWSPPTFQVFMQTIFWEFGTSPIRAGLFVVCIIFFAEKMIHGQICDMRRSVIDNFWLAIISAWVLAFTVGFLLLWSRFVPTISLFHRRYLLCLIPWGIFLVVNGLDLIFRFLIAKTEIREESRLTQTLSYCAMVLLLFVVLGFDGNEKVNEVVKKNNTYDITYTVPVLYSKQADWLERQNDIYLRDTVGIFSNANETPTIAWKTYYLEHRLGPDMVDVYSMDTESQLFEAGYDRIYVCLPWSRLKEDTQMKLQEGYKKSSENTVLQIYVYDRKSSS